jgi:hypothetical protein
MNYSYVKEYRATVGRNGWDIRGVTVTGVSFHLNDKLENIGEFLAILEILKGYLPSYNPSGHLFSTGAIVNTAAISGHPAV